MSRVDRLQCGEVAAVAEGECPGPAAASFPFGENLASSVTRQVLISGPTSWQVLLVGVDTLDVNLHVDWGKSREKLFEALEKGKKDAENSNGIPFNFAGREDLLIAPVGKKRLKYQLIHPFGRLYLGTGKKRNAEGNLFITPLAKWIWKRRVFPLMQEFVDLIGTLGGRVERMQISRCDLTADFLLPGGLTLEFLRHYAVTRSRGCVPYLEGKTLETYYAGNPGAMLCLRIYNKSREIEAHPEKGFFLKLWNVEENAEVWRVEYQLRRAVLREYGVNTLEDLQAKSGGIWSDLTQSWFSLRDHDNPNQSRRSVLTFWQAVQSVGEHFGSEIPCKRQRDFPTTIDTTRHVNQAAGLLVGFAVRRGLADLGISAGEFLDAVLKVFQTKPFDDKYRVERIKLGFHDSASGGEQ